jgi:cell division transport system permease protein
MAAAADAGRRAGPFDPELDLPLADTSASRLLTWIAGGLVLVAVLAFAIAASADGAMRRLEAEPRFATVVLPPTAAGATLPDAEVARVVTALEGVDGVAFVRAVAPVEVRKLMEPWLGAGAATAADLPMPRLIDVGFSQGRAPDLGHLGAQVAGLVPGATIEDSLPRDDDEEGGAGPAARTGRVLRLLAVGVGLVALAALVLTVVLLTRMSLDLHAPTVDLLRLMGARDGWLARQFEHRALLSALRGGLAGFALAVLVLLGFTAAARLPAARLPASLALPPVDLLLQDWLLLGCVPVAGALATALVARTVARRALGRWR